MTVTFYDILDVEPEADVERIESAFRERVKECHPDVSDDPNAPEKFRRVSTARDVLVDADDRTQYDRLGHKRYVRRYVDDSSWPTDPNAPATGPTVAESRHPREDATNNQSPHGRTTGSETSRDGTASESTSSYRNHRPSGRQGRSARRDQTTWLGDSRGYDSSGTRTARSSQRATGRGTTTVDSEEWQRASDAYRRADTTIESDGSLLRSVVSGIGRLGGWLLIHVVFVASALATAWFTYTQASTHAQVSVPFLVTGVLVIGLVVFLSILHMISQVYS